MENELSRIGMIVYDLRLGKGLTPHIDDFTFLEEEFRRIIMQLGSAWHQNLLGLPYLLEFHRIETLRLMEVIVKLESFQIELAQVNQQDDFLQEVHVELMLHFAQLLNRIDQMVETLCVAAKPFNLN
jgi:hypothetical protein